MPLKAAVKTARPYLRKRHVAASAVRAILEEVKTVGVQGFREWADHEERRRRFQALSAAMLVVGAESSVEA